MNRAFTDRTVSRRRFVSMHVVVALTLIGFTSAGNAQVTTITPTTSTGNLGTNVASPVNNVYSITGGARVGTNLFHSFNQFSVGAGDIANFQNTQIGGVFPQTSNILSRVTGGNPSLIYGTLRTTDFGNANLFLMNPAGILFGATATLDIGAATQGARGAGSFFATTADYLRMGDGPNAPKFYADPAKASVLSASPVSAFGFLGPNAASIAVQGATLQVGEGQTIGLIGGNRTFQTNSGEVPSGVTVVGGTLSAPSGRIYLASVDSAGEVVPALPTQPAGLDVSSFSKLGRVELSGGTVVDVSTLLDADFNPLSDLGNGSVHIRGGQFVMDGATIAANNFGTLPGEATAVSIEISKKGNATGGDATISGGSLIQSVNVDAPGGNVAIAADSLTINGVSGIQTDSAGAGAGGNITIAVTGAFAQSNSSFVQAVTEVSGNGGRIDVSAKNISVTDSANIGTASSGPGNGGDVSLTASQNIEVNNRGLISSVASGGGGASNIAIAAGDTVTLTGPANQLTPVIRTLGGQSPTSKAGDITIGAKHILLQQNALIDSDANAGQTGNIALAASESVTLSGGSRIFLRVRNQPGGSIDITAPSIALDGASIRTRVSGPGNAASISLSGDSIAVTNSQILADTLASGRAGSVTLTASDAITVSGQFTNEFGQVSSGGVFSEAVLSTGAGGNIGITANSLTLTNGGTVSAKTSGTAATATGGTVTVNANHVQLSDGGNITAASSGPANAGSLTLTGTNGAAQSVQISGANTGIFTDASGIGTGGNISVTAGAVSSNNGGILSAKTSGNAASATGGTITVNADQVQVNNGGLITAESTGIGNAGAVNLNATGSFQSNGGIVRTTAAQAQGGDITVKAGQSVQLSNGGILSASSAGAGKAGNVTVAGLNGQTPSVQITGNGSGLFTDASGSGAGGNISITAGSFSLNNGGKLSATTSGNAASAIGGTIIVNANQVQVNNGGLITAASTGQGNAGNITINATGDFQSNGGIIRTTATQAQGGDITITAGQDIVLTNGSSTSASSTGPGNAGNITALAGGDFIMQNSSITTQAAQASGGNIKIGAQDQVVLQNSLVSASVQGGSGSGGNIDVDPTVVVLQNSQILAQAVLGNGGNITITTPLFLADQSSVVSASSQFGLNGTVTIQSPTSNLSGTVASLPSSMRQAHALQTGRCAALANSQSSSFLIAGRETVPTEPGGWLPSPFALVGDGMGLAALGPGEWQGAGGEAQVPMMLAPADGTVSVRRLTPAGFLTQSFAEGESTGCHS